MTRDKLQYFNQVSDDIESLTKLEEALIVAIDKGPESMGSIVLQRDSFKDRDITRRLCMALRLVVSQELKDLTTKFNEG